MVFILSYSKFEIPSYTELVAYVRNEKMDTNIVSTENVSENDKQDEQSKNGHSDLAVEHAETMDMYVYVQFIVY